MTDLRAIRRNTRGAQVLGVFALLILVIAGTLQLDSRGQIAQAASIAVTTTEDRDATCGDEGVCSLREALADARSGDTVTIPAGTYRMSRPTAFTIDIDVSLVGEGREITIIEGGEHPAVADSGIFVIEAGSIVTMTGLEIRNGNSLADGGGIGNRGVLTVKDSWIHNNWAQYGGGGIWNRGGFFGEGKLTLENSQVDFNRAGVSGGGIHTEGNATITDSFVDDNSVTSSVLEELGGGGIFNFGTLDVTNSSVGSNAAVAGGGIYNNFAATLNVFDSYIQFNDAETDGGGLYNRGTANLFYSGLNNNEAVGSGGGLFNRATAEFRQVEIRGNSADQGGGAMVDESGKATFVNATVSGNTAVHEGGGLRNLGETTFTNATITQNTANRGGGVFDLITRALYIGNTILYGNTITSDVRESPECFGSLESDGYNIVGGITSCFFDEIAGDMVGVDPMLQDLGLNGGPTETFALSESSPAIDAAGTDFAPGIDQRGMGRPFGLADIGAHESSPGEILRVAHERDDATECPGNCSLRGSILNAKPGDAIVVPTGTYTVDSALLVDKDVSITGYGTDRTTVQAGTAPRVANHRVMTTGTGFTIVISEMTIRHGDLGGNGGGIGNFGDLTLWRTAVRDNSVFADLDGFSAGGGIFSFVGSSLNVVESAIRENTVGGSDDSLGAGGGGIKAVGSDVVIERSAITGNSAALRGGGMAIENSSLRVINSTISENTSGHDGGGVWFHSSSPENPALFNHVSVVRNEILGEGAGAGLWGGGS